MSSNHKPARAILARSPWLPTILLAAAGVAAGFYLAGPASGPRTGNTTLTEHPNTSATAAPAELVAGDVLEQQPPADRGGRSPGSDTAPLPAHDGGHQGFAGAPDVAVDADGRVCLVWASITGETEQTVFLSKSAAGLAGLSSPQAIVRSPIAFRSQGNGKKGYAIRMAPHVVAQGNAIFATWSEAVPDETTVNMVLVKSTDDGATFSQPLCVHTHPHARPTFTALAIGRHGQLACTWLDGRALNQHPFASVRPTDAGDFLPEFKLPGGQDEKGACPCCPTAATFAPDGTLFVAFRDLVDGYRDLSIVRLRPGDDQFEGPFAITPPAWKFDGCPHDGPSLVVANDRLHVTWMDAHTGVQRVYYGRASLDDLKFEVQPLHAQGPGTQGNARLYADARGGIHAIWEESLEHEAAAAASGHQHGPPAIGSGRGISYAYAPKDSEAFESVRLVHPVAASYQSRPAIAGDAKGQIYVAWCELNQEGKSIVVTSVAGEAGPKLTHRNSR